MHNASLAIMLLILVLNTGRNSSRLLSGQTSWRANVEQSPLSPPIPKTEDKLIDGEYDRQSYCAGRRPCIALLSTTNRAGVVSPIDPRTLTSRGGLHYNNESSLNLRRRVLVRNAYCAAYHCDVIVDYTDYSLNRTMWLSNHGKHRVGPMPPHWNKVAGIKRWLDYGIYDAVVLLDMDSVLHDFSTNIYDILDDTKGMRYPGNPSFVMFRHGDVSRCVVDNWWSFGTSPGCRYLKFPENHMGQTQNLDMPWLWYSVLYCAQEFSLHELAFECLDQCNGPSSYVDHLMKSPDHNTLFPLWIGECYRRSREPISEALEALGFIDSNSYRGKIYQTNLEWGTQPSELEAMNLSVSVHRKDSEIMVKWLGGMEELLLGLNCTPTDCFGAKDGAKLLKEVTEWWSAWSKSIEIPVP